MKTANYNTTDFSKTDSLINSEQLSNQGWIYLINQLFTMPRSKKFQEVLDQRNSENKLKQLKSNINQKK